VYPEVLPPKKVSFESEVLILLRLWEFFGDEATLPVGMISSTLTTAAIKDMALQVGLFK